jgi:translation initiation factor 4G
MFQQPPPNYQPDPQRNLGMLGPGKNPMDQNNPRMMYPGGPPPSRMDREGSGGFTDRRSDSNSNSRERELGLPGPMGPPKDVELSLRPPSANMLFKPKTPSLLPKSAIGRVNDHGSSPLGENSLLGPPPMQVQKVMMQQKEAPILIKQGSLDGKGRKEKNRQAAAAANKGPTREEVFDRVDSILDEMLVDVQNDIPANVENCEEKQDEIKEEEKEAESSDKPSAAQESNEIFKDGVSVAIEAATNRWKENDGWLPSKMTQTAVTHIYKRIIMRTINKKDREVILSFLLQLNKDGALDDVHFREAFDKVLNEKINTKDEKEKGDEEKDALDVEQVMSNLAHTALWKVKEKLASLSDIAELTSDKVDRVSVLLITLQGLSKPEYFGQDGLKELFDAANIKLMDQIAEESRNDAKLASILMDYDLSFLMPLLTIRQEMVKQLASNPGNAEALGEWVNENVPSKYLEQDDFVVALFSVVFSHIVASTTFPAEESADKTVQPEKALVEAEKDLVSKFGVVLRPYVVSNASLQLTAAYALQVFNHDLGFPKGMLLRSFVNCYELDILDEHAFLQWREDVSDDYPGKGKALFQVNNWLTWLEEAESEEDEEDDD